MVKIELISKNFINPIHCKRFPNSFTPRGVGDQHPLKTFIMKIYFYFPLPWLNSSVAEHWNSFFSVIASNLDLPEASQVQIPLSANLFHLFVKQYFVLSSLFHQYMGIASMGCKETMTFLTINHLFMKIGRKLLKISKFFYKIMTHQIKIQIFQNKYLYNVKRSPFRHQKYLEFNCHQVFSPLALSLLKKGWKIWQGCWWPTPLGVNRVKKIEKNWYRQNLILFH